MRAFLVGLTGGLASGKTTVSRWLAAAGCTVIDADALVAELYRAGGAGATAIREAIGGEVMEPGGGVDHRALASRLFADPTLRLEVERLIHPLVQEEFRRRAGSATGGIVVLEATRLVEGGFAGEFDLVVTIESSRRAQLDRALARGMTEGAATARLEAQGDGAARRAAADIVVRNDGTLSQLREATDGLVREIERRAAEVER